MTPEYAPAAGVPPDSVTLTLPEAPGASDRLCLSRAKLTPGAWRADTTERVRFAALDPVLVTWSCLAIDSDPDWSTPNESVAGLEVTVAETAAPASSFPAPMDCTPTELPELSLATAFEAELTRADLICATVKLGCLCFTSAAAPETSGVEKL